MINDAISFAINRLYIMNKQNEPYFELISRVIILFDQI